MSSVKKMVLVDPSQWQSTPHLSNMLPQPTPPSFPTTNNIPTAAPHSSSAAATFHWIQGLNLIKRIQGRRLLFFCGVTYFRM